VNESEGTRGPDEPVGSAADEAAKLWGAVADWARERAGDGPAGWGTALAGLAGQTAAAAHDVDAHLATDAEECRYCPVCRAIRVFRAASPEVREHLVTAATSLAQAAAALLATEAPDGRDTGVEHIDLDGDWPDDEGPDHAGPDHAGPDHVGPDHEGPEGPGGRA